MSVALEAATEESKMVCNSENRIPRLKGVGNMAIRRDGET